jgi:hypothetical protein
VSTGVGNRLVLIVAGRVRRRGGRRGEGEEGGGRGRRGIGGSLGTL